jgi:hypothetical protein
MKQNMNKTQILGLAIVGLSLFTYMGGSALVSGLFNLSFTGMTLKITVKDTASKPIQGAVVSITGIDWQDTGVYVPLGVTLKPTGADGTSGSSISTWGRAYLSVSADGYETAPGSMSAGSAETVSKTFKLTKTPDPIPEPIPDPIPEPEPEPDQIPEPEPDPISEPAPTPDADPDVDVTEDIENVLQTYSLFSGALGVGLFTLGSVKRDEKQ